MLTTTMMIYLLLNVVTTTKNSKPVLRVMDGIDDIESHFESMVTLESDEPILIIPKADGSEMKSYRLCSGSLLSEVWVLTSASCIVPKVTKVRYGDRRAACDAPNTFAKVQKRFRHPGYVTRDNDIGLLLVERIAEKPIVKLSALDYPSLMGYHVNAAGFGDTHLQATLTNPNASVQVIDGIIVPCPHISEKVRNGPFICMGSKCGSESMMLDGDEGGPVLYDGKVVGVATKQLMHFCPVSPYLTWLKETMLTNCKTL